MTMTVEFLRSRLLAERSASKAAKERIQELSKKVGIARTFSSSRIHNAIPLKWHYSIQFFDVPKPRFRHEVPYLVKFSEMAPRMPLRSTHSSYEPCNLTLSLLLHSISKKSPIFIKYCH